MTPPDTTNATRLGEAVHRSVQKLTARKGATLVRAALAGEWSPVLERDLISRCAALPGADLVRIASEEKAEDCLANTCIGTFDVVGLAAVEERHTASLKWIKPLLKRGGYLFIEMPGADVSIWQEAMRHAGFQNIVGGKDGARSSNGLELLMARSDGQVRTRIAVANEASRESAASHPANGHVGGSTTPANTSPAIALSDADCEAVLQILGKTLQRMLALSSSDLDVNAPFMEYGVDSIGGVALVNEINRQFHSDFSPTILFDYASLNKLAIYIVSRGVVAPGSTTSQSASVRVKSDLPTQSRTEAPAATDLLPGISREASTFSSSAVAATDIAIIGMSGRFPDAENIDAFWNNLRAGKNSISEVPGDRWDHHRFFDSAASGEGKTKYKWGGFLSDADKFDPLFFNISGREAEATDPQHRLFLEEAYHALEDAGYAGPSAGFARKCGVFAGVEPGDYLHRLMELHGSREHGSIFQGNAESILAARIAYFLDLKGPGIAVNTACSSSLVAIHLACQSLIHGECDLALAGGVRVFSSEKAYLALGQMGMLSTDGQCHTFDENANGFVPGEAVGVLVLKPLEAALRAGDSIHGVIRGSAINQDGRTNGITAPSSLAQTEVQREVYRRFQLDPGTFQYVEAHGTGTKLGDPIEIQALTQSFRDFYAVTGSCAIGSVKTNIGHTMAAAGVCSVIKVLLAMREREIPPSLNLVKTNPYIDFMTSPFVVNTALRPWLAGGETPRRAAVNSFGFSGTNSHLVLEEAPSLPEPARLAKPAWLIPLSGKTVEALRANAARLVFWLEGRISVPALEDISFTLHIGRAHLAHRVAIVTASIAELIEALHQVAKGTAADNIFHSIERARDPNDDILLKPLTISLLRDLSASAHNKASYREKLNALAALYAKGFDIDGSMLHESGARRRVSLPGYAFARDRYWLESDSAEQTPVATMARLHPLLHRNVSTVAQVQFGTALGEDDFVLREHRIRGQGVLPGAAYLEMVLVAAKLAGIAPMPRIGRIAWLRPLTEDLAHDILLRITEDSGGYGFEITSRDGERVHSRGVIMTDSVSPDGINPIAAIQERCSRRESPAVFYQLCTDAGLELGNRFRSIREIGFGSGEAFAWLGLPGDAANECAQFQLHPGLLDGAFQVAAMLSAQKGTGLPVPYALASAQVHAPLVSPCFAHVCSVDFSDNEPRCDITLFDANGATLVELQGLQMRALPSESVPQITWVRPRWKQEDRSVAATGAISGKVLLFQKDASEVSPAHEKVIKGVTFVRVRSASAWEVQDEIVGLRFGDAEDMERLVRYFQPRFAIFDCTGPATHALRREGAIAEVFQPILSFAQALIRAGLHAQVHLMAHVGLHDEALAHALAGFARTLRLENPNLRLSVVQAVETATLDVLLVEWQNGSEGHIRLALEQRQTQALQIFSPVAASNSLLRNQGVYLITGGLGAIGRTLARHLALNARARLALVGRSAWDDKNTPFFRELESFGAEPVWFSADVSRDDQVSRLIAAVKSRFGCIHGIIHAAGIVRDGFLLKKTMADFAEVLAVKAAGAEWLDLRTHDEPLDFFANFSSIAAVLGNIGQADYAAANGYLHGFALHREALRQRGERRGRTVSISWPLWRDGGMGGGDTGVEMRKLAGIGLTPLDNATAWQIFETALTTDEPWVMPLFGDPAAITRLLRPAVPGSFHPVPVSALSPAISSAVSEAAVFKYLAGQFSGFAKIPANRVEKNEPLEKYGIDSMMVMEFTQRLEKDFGELSKTLLFEYQTLGELTDYFREHHASRLQALLQTASPTAGNEALSKPAPVQAPTRMAPVPTRDESIAIVGLFGRFPMAEDMDEFWANLRDGRDCITEIPDGRWDYRLFHDPVRGIPGKTINKWGGFLKDVAHFDATFFGVTPREAFVLDPQERLFLEAVWRTVEDAGYRKSSLANRAIGVFAGVMYGQYQLYGAGNVAAGEVFPLSSSYASIANRVSYFFNWHGPSMAVDTMCSSSLTAIHLACESIRRDESEMAIAGGVNVTIHPHKDALLAPGGFAASDGRCRSFGEGGDGYVPGEGVGAVLLKPLAQAQADGDHIYGIVRGSSVNHGGKTNGYTVPNPRAQGELILAAMERGGVTPEMVTCIEAHGTGTSLGDPVELAGLTKAFREASQAGEHPAHLCALGSVKSNIGHLESAAGIAGVAKVLLQMRHGQLVPSLHSVKANPHLRLDETPFFIPQELQTWNSPGPRLAGISSFGAGGANAHLILQECEALPARETSPEGPYLFILSARSEDRLFARARQIEAFLSNSLPPGIYLEDIAWTLQNGREPLEERLAWLAGDQAEALAGLRDYLAGTGGGVSWHRGTIRPGSDGTALWEGEEGRAWVESLMRHRKWEKLGQFWVSGGAVAWEDLYTGRSPRRVPLPTYPFAGERYWAPDHLPKVKSVEVIAATAEPSEALFLRPVWQETIAPTVPFDLGGRLWIFDNAATLSQLIASRFPQLLVTRIGTASDYLISDGYVTLDPARAEDYRQLVATGAPHYVIHGWAPADGNADETWRLGVGSLFHLTRALGASGLEESVRLLYCHFSATPLNLAMSAFLRSVGQEQPLIDGRVVQVDGPHEDIMREFFAKPIEREIHLQRHSRKVRSFEKFDLSGSVIAFRTGGTFLITGGLGGLGYLFAEYLASHFQARLVLTGRSALTDETQARLASLNRDGARAVYVRGDVASAADVGEVVSRAHAEFGAIHGIIHAAGVLKDSFLLRKDFGDLATVLAPKLGGVECLDQSTIGEPLDFFVCMSSTAGVFGNAGQCDYAFANAAMDAFAHRRDEERRVGRRQGRTLSINWSLWKDGGMSIMGRHVEEQLAHVGLHPLPGREGIALFQSALACGESQVVPLWGDARRLARTFLGQADETSHAKGTTTTTTDLDDAVLEERTRTYLAATLAAVTQLAVDRLDADQRFEEFGVDSIVVGDFNMRLERDLGPISKTLLFEHPNLRKLSRHLAKAARAQLQDFFSTGEQSALVAQTGRESIKESTVSKNVVTSSDPASVVEVSTHASVPAIRTRNAPLRPALEDIAIIGLAGRYPKAPDLRAFWNVLKEGIDCVTEIPKDRWDIEAFYDADPARAVEGRMYARWGAFIDDVDKFDPLFFNLAPIEAEAMDPQERLFLETAWSALEDAGYTRRDLARMVRKEFAANVGVFAGMTTSTYDEVARDVRGHRAMPTTLPWSLANRVSHLFNFNGPSMPVDTACSSSLTAIHLACEAIRSGQCQQAIAGGVNLYLHPSKYINLCLMRMLSTDGKCRAFGAGGDGFVPGEGVGVVVLKPLSLAVADGDAIYGVIKGTAINHGGRTNGYTVPNPAAQSELITQALKRSGIEPDSLGYLEAHGTGTALGDPIELAGLSTALAGVPRGACALGSVKTNIGHLESAAGIAGLTKVLLQMKHRQLVPSLHAQQTNPNLDLGSSPFMLQRELAPWIALERNGRALPRRAGISSFGAGGSNAHVIVEEYVAPPALSVESVQPKLIVLSARKLEVLRAIAQHLALTVHETSEAELPLSGITETLQTGREAMEERVAFVVSSREELYRTLLNVAAGQEDSVIRGRVKREKVQTVAEDNDVAPLVPEVATAIDVRDLISLARLWVGGAEVDWAKLRRGRPMQRVHLPGYAFSRQRYWIPTMSEDAAAGVKISAMQKFDDQGWLHPLLEQNRSTFAGQVFTSRWTGEETVLAHHVVGGRKILPAAASLELSLAAACTAMQRTDVTLQRVVWLRTIVATETGAEVVLRLGNLDAEGRSKLELFSGDEKMMECWAVPSVRDTGLGECIDLPALRSRCGVAVNVPELYHGMAERGLVYGPGFRSLHELAVGSNEVWGRLNIPESWHDAKFRLHPALVDGALQSLAPLTAMQSGGIPGVAGIPFALEEAICAADHLPAHCEVWARVESVRQNGVVRYDIKIVESDTGFVAAQLRGLSVRSFAPDTTRVTGEGAVARSITPPELSTFFCRPIWIDKPLEPGSLNLAAGDVIVIFDDEPAVTEVLSRVGDGTHTILRVVRGSTWAQANDSEVTVCPNEAGDYEQLLGLIAAKGLCLRAVLHLWSRVDANRDETLVHGMGSIHLLVQALLRTGRINARIIFGFANGIPAYEAVSGYGKTLRQEQPHALFTAVGYDPGMLIDWATELTQAGDEREARWLSGGRRESLSLDPVMLESGIRIEEDFPADGVYLITGGGGSLGYLFARHLVEKRGGRVVLMGRSDPSATLQEWLMQCGDRAMYYRGDVGSAADVQGVFADTREKFGRLDGVLHAAGVLRDKLIFNLSLEDMNTILHAKLAGAEALLSASTDEATSASQPRWIAFFSSTAGLLGSAGQGGYAFANACLDSLARQATTRQRSPHVVSINWPLWKEGGMQAPELAVRRQEQELGISPLETSDGIAAWEMILASGLAQCAVFSGTPSKFYRALGLPFAQGEGVTAFAKNAVMAPATSSMPPVDPGRLMDELKSQVARVLKLEPSVLEADAEMSEYGFDSITLTSMANGLNSEFGLEITPATLFEYATLQQLGDFLLRDHSASVAQKLGGGMAYDQGAATRVNKDARTEVEAADRGQEVIAVLTKSPGFSDSSSRHQQEPIAVIGMSGVFPGSPDLASFWRHIDEGKDLITRAPRERWNFAQSTAPREDPSTLAAPWGGFLAGIELFDPLFFGISPREAELMDPQQRLFLQTVWHLLEDAGYPRAALAGTKTGVFVGVAANDYANLLAMQGAAVEAYSSTGNAHSVLVNRVSYFLDIHGPSEALDTACSSSLVAIHRAIESIASGSSEMAIVGGVNVLLSPGAFLAFGKAGMLGEDGRCKSFDAAANGYVRGEGVGAILLKPLSLAERDGDRIHAVIRGSAENHGGRVQSLTVPNPHAQARVLQDAFARAGIDPHTIGCIEAHGTGTSLGDPIEINALVKAFGTNSGVVPAPRCAIASVKTNIGHLETAAGIAGIIKMLLALRHQRIPGNVHLRQVNPYIQVKGTPFWFPRESTAWEALRDREGRSLPRCVGVSSFGFGGANAHVVLEEYFAVPSMPSMREDQPGLFVFSARNPQSLRENVSRMIEFLHSDEGQETSLSDLAFTLQTGREAMEERLAVTASSRQELLHRIEAFLADEKMVAGLTVGNVIENKPALQLLRQVHENDDFLEVILQAADWPRLAKLWVNGLEISWAKIWKGSPARRIGLPGYAFSCQRYWVPADNASKLNANQIIPFVAVHPTVQNTPELRNNAPIEEVPANGKTSRHESLVKYLINEFAAFSKMDPTKVRATEPLEKYGFDSIMAVEFSTKLEGVFGPLSKTLLFEYPAIELLAGYLEKQFPEQVAALLPSSSEIKPKPELIAASHEEITATVVASESAEPSTLVPLRGDIAIIGLSGRLPQADTLEEFWANLVAGRDSIEEIPGERWDYRAYFDPKPGAPGTSYNKWGGFLRDVDKFDPLFFGISPREAEILDPQERLFLETVWQTLEDAGYPQSGLTGRKGGVFVGVMYGQYQLFGVEESMRSGEVKTLSSSYASIANRVSWFFDWHGPSLALDAMCSSALQSIHLACKSLLQGESEFAIAGGVNLILHPHKEIGLAQAGFLNREGRCRSFGRTDGRGYIAGEGVGAVMLKPLAAALRDGDQIHGIIKGSASNHGGRTNSYATPNLHSQAAVTAEALRVAGVDPRTITCVEAAATGSAVGDALEVRGLVSAFGLTEKNQQFCALGSVKSNIGHLEAASGMAGLAKVLLQMKHRQLVQSLHTAELNPDIDWCSTPFFVVQQATEWKAPQIDGQPAPRRAGLSAFGAGGSNAHVVVEEFVERSHQPEAGDGVAQLFVLSAKTLEALRARARQLAEWWEHSQKTEAPMVAVDIAYTLQTGREPMSERLAFIAGDANEALPILHAFANGEEGGDRWCHGTTDGSWQNGGVHNLSSHLGHLRHFAEQWVIGGRAGEAFPFAAELAACARRISLPGYPFARERCWFTPAKSEARSPVIIPVEVSDITVIGDQLDTAMAVLRPVLAAALKIAPERISLKHRFTDLGLDSVTAPIVLQELHRATGIDVAPATLMELNTVETFATWLAPQLLRPAPKHGHNGTNGNGTVKASVTRSEILVAGTRGLAPAVPLISSRTKKKRRFLPLAPMDYLFTGARRFAIQVFYHFPQGLNFAELRHGLHRVTQEFYPINSVLRKRGACQYILQEASEHPDFAEVICPASYVIPQLDNAASFAPFRVNINPHRQGEKMAKFRLFQLERGSLLSVNLSHAIADGYSYSYFLSSWAAACRGEDFLPPEVSRRKLIQAAADAAKLGDITGDWHLAELSRTVDPLASRLDLLTFEGEGELSRARTAAPPDVRERITENGVLTALTWQAYAQALSDDLEPLLLACPINFRRKASYLSPSFFGNAAAPALIQLPREEVLQKTVWELALRISDTIGSADETLLARYNAAIDAYRRKHGLAAMSRAALSSSPHGLIVTNVARFMLPPVDFGTGPFAAELTPHNYAGTAVISGREGEPIQVRIAHPLAEATPHAAP